ncbi:MAG: HD domain-containing protein [Armatimonadetes bacterium]|nr:HD domain-containing protein [Armatimonadota bacterium]NIM22829.1 HD domain-containing protein [Armatimonadota bacterium]NIM66696.1 HD domain-containing protein [Armatimonadota bacterium]NIM75253.1 HD domain-containing protein [Armatimonadota bacterium]NIN04894.1 HD domain-containing protein [Armatimonadota bacterium]
MLRAVSRWLIAIIVSILLIAITWLVLEFRGIAASYTHLYYIPIILAAVFLGDVRGVIVALIAAGLSGWVTYTTRGLSPVASEIVIRTMIFFAIAVLTARLSAILKEKGEEASSLFTVSHAVSQSLRLDDILPNIARMSAQITEGQASIIRLLARKGDELRPAASWGLSSDYISKGPVRVSDSVVDQEVKRGKVVMLSDLRQDHRAYHYRQEAIAEGLLSCICVPLQRGERFLGVLRVYSDYPRHWSRRDERLLRALAGEAAVAIENAQLHETLRRSYWETVRALTRAIEAKDPQMLGHSERVTGYVLQIARQMGLSPDEMEILRFAATLHDIGKIAVEEQLLRVSNPQAYRDALEKNHPLVGMSILQPAEFLRSALDGVRYHHERYDGTGYPEGLKGEQIPLQARLLAVANGYDALTHPPSGKEPLSPQSALAELERQAGSAFDPGVVDALSAALGKRVERRTKVETPGSGSTNP